MKTLIKNIREIVQVREEPPPFLKGQEMQELPCLQNGYLLIEDDRIGDFGQMIDLPELMVDKTIDAKGKTVIPTWCDSHTHLVYAGSRINEFVDRINGHTYEEIAARGGGILNSARILQQTSEQDLYRQSSRRVEEIMQLGTGAVEIKSGYGLTFEAELKMLRVIRQLSENYPLAIKATFLGAHAIPQNYDDNKSGYIKMLIEELMPEIAEEKLANYVDVFCEKEYFDEADVNKICSAGHKYGLIPKLHVNQFNSIGGIQAAVAQNALTVDHLEVMQEEDFETLQGAETMAVGLPNCSYYLGIPYAPARRIIDEGLSFALASDYNPGSAPSGNMNFVVAAGCIKMNMTPEEAINAATINGAYAMGITNELGSITRGKYANLIITTEIDSYSKIPYSFGSNLIDQVFIRGKII